MGFRPEEIALKRFVIRLRGYDTQEVDTFLRAVADDYRRVTENAAETTEKLHRLLAGDRSINDVRWELGRLVSRLDSAIEGFGAIEDFDRGRKPGLRVVYSGSGI